MAIKKTGTNSHLGNVSVESLSALNEFDAERTSSTSEESVTASPPDNQPKKKKNIDNWGRPRKELIPGIKEVSVTIQLPKTVLAYLRKKGKKEGKSLKELIGHAIITQYPDSAK